MAVKIERVGGAERREIDPDPDFVDLVDLVEARHYRNVLILQLREDGALESFINAQHTDAVDHPHDYMMLGAVEAVIRHAHSAAGMPQPKAGSDEWRKILTTVLLHLARMTMSD